MLTTLRMMNLSATCNDCTGAKLCPHLSLSFRLNVPEANYVFTVKSKLNVLLKYRTTPACVCTLEVIRKDRTQTFSYPGYALDELITRATCLRQIGHNSPLTGKISHKDISSIYFATVTLHRDITDSAPHVRISACHDERRKPHIDISLLALLFMDVALEAAADILTLINVKVDSILRSGESLANRSRKVLLKELIWDGNFDLITPNNLGIPLYNYMASVIPANIVDKTEYNIRLTNNQLVIDD